jgi:hypothetical protein
MSVSHVILGSSKAGENRGTTAGADPIHYSAHTLQMAAEGSQNKGQFGDA